MESTFLLINSAFLLIPFTVSGCGLLYPEELEQRICDRKSDISLCEKANRELGIADDACLIWQCREDGKGCEWGKRDEDFDGFPDEQTCKDEVDGSLDCDDHNTDAHEGLEEVCDGVDNDCDGYIDEGQLERQLKEIELHSISLRNIDGTGKCKIDHPIQLAVASTQPSPTQTIGAVQEKPSADPDVNGIAWLAEVTEIVEGIERDTRAGSLSVENGEYLGISFSPLSYQHTTDAGLEKDGCSNAIRQCDYHHIGFDRFGEHLLVISENHSNNTRGELRIGVTKTADTIFDLREVKEASGNPRLPYAGVDSSCNGGTSEGASSPSVATLTETQDAYALVLWLNENNNENRNTDAGELGCESSPPPVPLMACGIQVENVTLDLTRIEAEDLLQIGQTTNLGPVALLPWVSDSQLRRGFLAAYADQKQKIAFTRFDLQNNQEITLSSCSPDIPIDRVEHIALAMGDRTESGSLRILSAYRVGCDENSEVGVALYDFDLEVTSACSAIINTDIETLRISEGGVQVEAGPVLAYGHLARPKRGDSISGWVVTWIEQRDDKDSLMGFRVVADEDGRLKTLEETPFELVRSESLESPVAFSKIDSERATQNVFFAVVDDCTASPVLGRTFCVPDN